MKELTHARQRILRNQMDIEREQKAIEKMRLDMAQRNTNIQILQREIDTIERGVLADEKWKEIDPENLVRPLVVAAVERFRARPSMVKATIYKHRAWSLERLVDNGVLDGYWQRNYESGKWSREGLQATILRTTGELLDVDPTAGVVALRTAIEDVRALKEAQVRDQARAAS